LIDGLRQTNFAGAYYLADIIANVLEDPLEHMAGGLEAFCDGDAAYTFLPPFPRRSALHRIAGYMIDALFYDADVEGYKPPGEAIVRHHRMVAELSGEVADELWVEHALREHGIAFEPFTDWSRPAGERDQDSVLEWFQDLRLSEEYDRLVDHLSRDVFAVLFGNRTVLRDLNRLIAQDLRSAGPPDPEADPELARFATAKGLAKRTAIPAWARRAVFYRDRGHCCFCHRDLGGLLTPFTDQAYDHIVPLAEGGINDVTNLQLLCGPCNSSKSSRNDRASNFYGLWYDDTDPGR